MLGSTTKTKVKQGQPAVCPTGLPCPHCDGIVTVVRPVGKGRPGGK